MRAITISLPDERFEQLQQVATRYGVTTEDLIRYNIEDLLMQPYEAFLRVVTHVLDKNTDLYRQIA